MTVYHFQIIYAVWTVWFAFLNKKWIETQSGFRHWANAISHLSAASFVALHFGFQHGVATLFMVRALFDGSLSMFRGLSFDYVSPRPRSLVDRFEKKVFGKNGMLPKLVYFTIAIILTFVQWSQFLK
jgi:hypothetical protein